MTLSKPLAAVALLLAPVSSVSAQIMAGDYFLVGQISMTHVRGSTLTTVPLPPGVSLSVASAARAAEHIPGTQYVAVTTGAVSTGTVGSGFTVHLLDFSSSIAAPTVSVLQAGFTSIAWDLDADPVTGDLYLLHTNTVSLFTAPVTPGVAAQTFATGQTGGNHVAAVPAGNAVVVSSSTATWVSGQGATGVSPDLFPGLGGSRNGLAVDPASGNIYVSRLPAGGGSVEAFAAAGTALATVLQAPEIVGAIDVKFDASQGLVLTVARDGAVIGGVPFGVQNGYDNVIVGAPTLGPSSLAQAFGPATGNGVSTLPVRLVAVRDLTPGLPLAQVAVLGAGCPGTGGLVPVLGTNGNPVLGNNLFAFLVSNGAPAAPAYLFVAAGAATPPLSLGGSCLLYIDPVSLQILYLAGVNPFASFPLDAAGAALLPVPIPNVAAYAGAELAFQTIIADPAGAPPGFVVTNGLLLTLGL